jgi:hypothetical protein
LGIGGVVPSGVVANADAGGQGIHGVEDDGFDALLSLLLGPAAVVQDGDKEAFGFARSGAGGVDVERRINARRRGAEGALELDPGAFEQAGVGVFDEALEGLIRGFVPEGEGGLEVVEDLQTRRRPNDTIPVC